MARGVPVIDELIGQNARERLTEVKRGLRSILESARRPRGAAEFRLRAGCPRARHRRHVGAPTASRASPRGNARASAPRSRRPRLAASVQRRIRLSSVGM